MEYFYQLFFEIGNSRKNRSPNESPLTPGVHKMEPARSGNSGKAARVLSSLQSKKPLPERWPESGLQMPFESKNFAVAGLFIERTSCSFGHWARVSPARHLGYPASARLAWVSASFYHPFQRPILTVFTHFRMAKRDFKMQKCKNKMAEFGFQMAEQVIKMARRVLEWLNTALEWLNTI